MTRRIILALAAGNALDRVVLEASLDLARLDPAHIEVLHPSVDPLTAIPIAGDPMSGALVAEILETLEQESRRRHDLARRSFDAWRAEHALTLSGPGADAPGPTVSWHTAKGSPAEIAARRARLAGIIVVGRTPGSGDAGTDDLLQALLFETGRPVLCVPPPTRPRLLSRPAILWNGSPQAARAVGDAMPMLARAAAVAVLAITGEDADPDATALVEALERGGIAASRQDVAPGEASASERLFAAAMAFGASVVVMGAYGHSRLREMVIGGVTRHALSHAALPLFMAH